MSDIEEFRLKLLQWKERAKLEKSREEDLAEYLISIKLNPELARIDETSSTVAALEFLINSPEARKKLNTIMNKDINKGLDFFG